MTEKEERAFRRAAETAASMHPKQRVLSFSWEGETFWIKKKQGNHRMQAVKYSVEQEFYYEAARIAIAARLSDCAPDLVFLTDAYMVLRDGGRTVHDWLLAGGPELEKRRILGEAGQALCRLHRAGLYHGRPALRDMTWNGARITLLDWENRTYFHDLPHRQMTDAVLLLQGMFREPWMQDAYVKAAWDGYRRAGGTALLRAAAQFLRRHRAIARVTGALHPFHFKDVESVRLAYRWFEDHAAELNA